MLPYFQDLSQVPEKELIPGFFVRMVHTENITIAYWSIRKGAKLPEHTHVHEQITTVLEGEFELSVNGKSKTLSSGKVAVIPGNVAHSGLALTECQLIDVFYPVREDYL